MTTSNNIKQIEFYGLDWLSADQPKAFQEAKKLTNNFTMFGRLELTSEGVKAVSYGGAKRSNRIIYDVDLSSCGEYVLITFITE